MKAKLPATAAALVNAVQPSVVDGAGRVGRVRGDDDVVGEPGRGDRRTEVGRRGVAVADRCRLGHEELDRNPRVERADADRTLVVQVALALVVTLVDQVEGLAPDVGVGLVERTGLPLVDQAAGVLGVGVAPLVRDDVVGRDAGAVVGRDAVPVGVGARDGRVVVDRDPGRAVAVVGVAVEGVLEEPVRLTRGHDLVQLVGVEGPREGVALRPLQVGGRRRGVVVGLVEPAVEVVVEHRPAVELLAGLRVEDHCLTHRVAVPHLADIGKVVLTRGALGDARPVDHELVAEDLQVLGLHRPAVAGHDRRGLDQGHRSAGGLGLGHPRLGGHVDARRGVPVDGGQGAVGVDVRLEERAEDGDALVGLGVGRGEAPRRVGGDAAARELALAGTEGTAVAGEVLVGLGGRRGLVRPGNAGQEVTACCDPGEADLTGGPLGGDRDVAAGGVADALYEAVVGCDRR